MCAEICPVHGVEMVTSNGMVVCPARRCKVARTEDGTAMTAEYMVATGKTLPGEPPDSRISKLTARMHAAFKAGSAQEQAR